MDKLPEKELKIKIPEGRHVAGPDAADKIDENFDKYRKSDKGKEAYKRYQNSDKGREAKKRYFQSDKGKAAVKRWAESGKGRDYLAGRRMQRQIFLKAKKLRDSNPKWKLDTCLRKAEIQVIEEYLTNNEEE